MSDALRRRLAAEHELRRSVERELHDGPQQRLVALAVELQLARGLAESDGAELGLLLDELSAQVHDALEELRRLAWRLYPSPLLDGGLVDALRTLGRVEADGVGRHPADVEAAVYFCCAELAARATGPVTVVLRQDPSTLRFDVRGDGLEPTDQARDRVEALGGVLAPADGGAGVVIPLGP